MLRELSIGFSKGSEEEAPAKGSGCSPYDPPSWLIARFLHQQRASGDVSLEMDLEVEELRGGDRRRDLPLAPRPPRQSRDGLRVSFQPPISAGDEVEDDLFLEEDLPEEFQKAKLGAVTLLQWVSLVLIIGALVCTFAIPALKRRDLWKLKLWRWEVLVLVLICGRLVSGWMIRLVVFFMERNFLLRKWVLYFVYGRRKAVQNCLWLGLVLIAWHALFDEKVERETNGERLRYVTKVLVCFLVGTLLWLVKTLSGLPVIEIWRTEEEEENTVDELQTLQKTGAIVLPDLRAAAFLTKSGMVVRSGGLQRSPRVKNTKLSPGLS